MGRGSDLLLDVNLQHRVWIRDRSRTRFAALDLVDVFHAGDDLPPDRVLARQTRAAVIGKADEKLAIGGVRVLRARRTDGSALIRLLRKFGWQIGQFRSAHAGAGRIARLRHEAVDDAMPLEAIIKALGRQLLDTLDLLRREVGTKLNDDLAG